MEKKELLLSVVVPVYNRADVVGATLESIANQCYRPFELILIDNGSTDGSLDFLRSWAKANQTDGMHIKVLSCTTPGAPAARNAGLREVSAPWVLFFDSDDTMPPTHLQKVAAAIIENDDARIIGWDTVHRRLDGSSHPGRFFGRDMQRHNLFDGSMATQRWAARTDLVKEVGAWNERVKYWNDIELGARMLAATDAIAYIGKSDVEVIESATSITSGGLADPARMEDALQSIERTLGLKGRKWCRIKRVMGYALSSRSGSPEGLAKMKELKAGPLLWLMYAYIRFGGRGIVHIIK